MAIRKQKILCNVKRGHNHTTRGSSARDVPGCCDGLHETTKFSERIWQLSCNRFSKNENMRKLLSKVVFVTSNDFQNDILKFLRN